MSAKDQVQAFIDGVLSGTLVVCRLVRLAVERHVDDLKHAGERGWSFDERKAAEACDFFPLVLRHSTGEWQGKPFDLSQTQLFIQWVLFGWRETSTGYRRFKHAYVDVARKWGKTEWLAGVALLLMVADEPIEPRAELYCVATMEKQAKRLHGAATRMVAATPSLRTRLKVFGGERSIDPAIVLPGDESTFQPLGSDSRTKDSLEPHAVFMDELHEWRERHRGLREKLETGSGTRRQPLFVTITTAGDDKSEMWIAERAKCTKVLDGLLDDRQFVFIASIDDGDNPLMLGSDVPDSVFRKWVASDGFEDVMRKANPNIGVSVKIGSLRDEAIRARHDATRRSAFLRYYCNIQTASTEKAIDAGLWAGGSGDLSDWSEADLVVGGFDLGRSDDFAAAGAVARFDDRFEARVQAWTCAERHVELRTPKLRAWVESDDVLLTECEGNAIDFDAVERGIVDMSEEWGIDRWIYDPRFAEHTSQRLELVHGLSREKFNQNHSQYNEVCRLFLRLLREGRFGHGDCPLLGWFADNLSFAKNNRDEWMPDKRGSKLKIDGIVATLMALAGAMQGEAESSWYTPGSLSL